MRNAMQNTVNEKDWRLFRSRLPNWQEAYMERLIGEYRTLLSGEDLASDKFWALEQRLREDKRNPGVLVTDLRRSTMDSTLLQLLFHHVISTEDLDGFSEELRERLLCGMRIWSQHDE